MWTFSEKLVVLTTWKRNSRCDSNGDLNRGSNHKSRNLKVRFELPERAIWGKFLRFGLRDFESLAICDLWFGALRPKVFSGLRCFCALNLPGSNAKPYNGSEVPQGQSRQTINWHNNREVLHGVRADGVGVQFPFCSKLQSFTLVVWENKRKAKKMRKNQRKTKKVGKCLRPHLHQPHQEPPKKVGQNWVSLLTRKGPGA